MPTVHVVKQGECLSSIARAHGFRNWKDLYDHPANAELKKRRPNPNVLQAGDPVAIPEPIPITATLPTGTWHEIKVDREEPRLRLRLVDGGGKPLKKQEYQITIDGEKRSGTTDGDGVVDEPIEHKASAAELRTQITRGDDQHELIWKLEIGSLDPVTKITGLQARLRNLQFYDGPINGNFDQVTRNALMAFQLSAKLDATGVADNATMSELEKQHDGPE